jgi:transcriptional regulator of acetoin/glycerol metabolism
MMVGYSLHIRLFHSLLSAGFYRRFLDVPKAPTEPKNHSPQTIPNGTASKEAILSTMQKTGWNVAKAARLLGMSRQHFYKKMKKFSIEIMRQS